MTGLWAFLLVLDIEGCELLCFQVNSFGDVTSLTGRRFLSPGASPGRRVPFDHGPVDR